MARLQPQPGFKRLDGFSKIALLSSRQAFEITITGGRRRRLVAQLLIRARLFLAPEDPVAIGAKLVEPASWRVGFVGNIQVGEGTPGRQLALASDKLGVRLGFQVDDTSVMWRPGIVPPGKGVIRQPDEFLINAPANLLHLLLDQ